MKTMLENKKESTTTVEETVILIPHNDGTVEVGYGKITLEIFQKAINGMLTRGGFALGSFATSHILATIGKKELAAGAMISTTRNFFQTGICGMTIAISMSLVEAKTKLDKGVFLKQQCGIALLGSGVAVPVMIFISPIMQMLGQSKEVSDITQDYLRGYAIGFPFLILTNTINQLMLATNRAESFCSTFAQQGLYIGLGYVLAFGEWGFKPLGPTGLGYASALSSILSFTGYCIYIQVRPMFREYGIFTSYNFNGLKIFGNLFRKGTSIVIQAGSEMLMYVCFVQLVGSLGNVALSATEIAVEYVTLVAVPTLSFNQANNIIASNYFNRKDSGGIRKAYYATMVFSMFCPLTFFALSVGIPKQLMEPFSDDSEVIALTKQMLLFSSVSTILDAIRFTSIGSLRGMKDMSYLMVVSFLSLPCLSVGLAYLLENFTSLGPISTFVSLDIGLTIAAAAIVPRTLYKMWSFASSAITAVTGYINSDQAAEMPTQRGFISSAAHYCCGFFWKSKSASPTMKPLSVVNACMEYHSIA